MSQGLVYADADAIYLVIDSAGVPVISSDGSYVMATKLLRLQGGITAICTGGTQHWADVHQQYINQPDIDSAAEHVRQLLASVTSKKNQAFARLCGYRNRDSVCYTIYRELDSADALKDEVIIYQRVEGIGINGEIAAGEAQSLIDQGTSPLDALCYVVNANINSVDIIPPLYSDVITL